MKQDKALILVRLLVGGVFLSEGIQKFLFPDADGANFDLFVSTLTVRALIQVRLLIRQ